MPTHSEIGEFIWRIATCLWILRNNKPPKHAGSIILIDGTQERFRTLMRRNVGNVKAITENLKTTLDEQRLSGQMAPCADRKLKWSLVTKDKHSSGEVVPLSHIGCNLHAA